MVFQSLSAFGKLEDIILDMYHFGCFGYSSKRFTRTYRSTLLSAFSCHIPEIRAAYRDAQTVMLKTLDQIFLNNIQGCVLQLCQSSYMWSIIIVFCSPENYYTRQ